MPGESFGGFSPGIDAPTYLFPAPRTLLRFVRHGGQWGWAHLHRLVFSDDHDTRRRLIDLLHLDHFDRQLCPSFLQGSGLGLSRLRNDALVLSLCCSLLWHRLNRSALRRLSLRSDGTTAFATRFGGLPPLRCPSLLAHRHLIPPSERCGRQAALRIVSRK